MALTQPPLTSPKHTTLMLSNGFLVTLRGMRGGEGGGEGEIRRREGEKEREEEKEGFK